MWDFVWDGRKWLTPTSCGVQEQTVLIGLTSLITKNPPMPPKFNRRRAVFVLGKIDEILAWEQRKDGTAFHWDSLLRTGREAHFLCRARPAEQAWVRTF